MLYSSNKISTTKAGKRPLFSCQFYVSEFFPEYVAPLSAVQFSFIDDIEVQYQEVPVAVRIVRRNGGQSFCSAHLRRHSQTQ